jgi:CRP/FNR family cyclic AMP-dependent transcriptional regulator
MPTSKSGMDLKESDFITQLSPEEKQFLEDKSYKKYYHKNSIIHSPGDKVNHVNYILSGRVKIYNLSESGKEIIYRFCGPNSFFGIAEICGGDRREVFAEAVEDTQALCLDREDFLELLESNHQITLLSLKILGTRLRRAHRAIQSLAMQDTNARLAHLLLKLVNDNRSETSRDTFKDKLTHQEMANMIGATRTTVTELINEYKAHDYIEYIDGKIRILNFDILRQLAEK